MSKNSSGTWIFMSCLIATWHDSRQPSRISCRVSFSSSVASTSPPPSSTWHLHMPQVPPPPQADDRKMPSAASAPSSLLPGEASMRLAGSSLMSIATLPLATSRARAARMTATSSITTTVKVATPNAISNAIARAPWPTAARRRRT